MKTIDYYGDLIQGAGARLGGFHRAVHQVVTPGDRVLEIGTGLGTFAFFAAQAGAAEVWAVDDGPVIHLARELASLNDPRGVVRFVRGRVPGVELPAPFDVVIFEDFGTALLDRWQWELLRFVQDELLAPGGRLVPERARLSLAPARVGPSTTMSAAGDVVRELGLDFSLLHPMLVQRPRRVDAAESALLGPPVVGEALALQPTPPPSALSCTARWTAPEGGRLDALLLWFDLGLAEDWVPNAPGTGADPWGQLLLPVDPPLDVPAGGRIEAEAIRETREDGSPGWWRWQVEGAGELRKGHEFASVLLGADELKALRR